MTVQEELDAAKAANVCSDSVLDFQSAIGNAYTTLVQEITKIEKAQAKLGPDCPNGIKQEGAVILQKFQALRTSLEAAHADLINWTP